MLENILFSHYHNHSEKKECNACSDWTYSNFQWKGAVTLANPKAINVYTGENCQELSVGRYIIRSMTNSVPAGLSSQLQCYQYNPDKAVIVDHAACEQELMKDNKATLRPTSKCKMLIRDRQKQERKLTVANMKENRPLLGSTSYGFNPSTTHRNPCDIGGSTVNRLYTASQSNNIFQD